MPTGLHLLRIAILAVLIGLLPGGEDRPAGISVVMDDNYPPFCFRDGDGRVQGILIDQWRLFEAKTGIPVVIHATDWDKALQRMRAGEFDVIDTIFLTAERSTWLEFTPPYIRLDQPIFFDREIQGISDAASLHDFPVAVKAGDAAIELLKSRGVVNLIPYASYEAIVLAAKERKVNVFVIDQPPAIHFLAKHGILDRFRVSAPLGGGEFHRAVRRGQSRLLAQVQDGFARITPEEQQLIERRWYGSPTGTQAPITGMLIVAGILAAILVILFVWNRLLRLTVERRTGELQRSLAERQEKSAFIRTLINTIPDLVWFKDAAGRYLVCNTTFERFNGTDEAGILGRTTHDLVGKELADTYCENDRLAIAAGGPRSSEEWIISAIDRRRILLETIRTPMFAADGRLLGVLGIGRDITARIRVEGELRDSQSLLNGVIEGTDDSIFVKDAAGRCILHNAALRQFFETMLGGGYPADGIIGKRDADYLPAAVADRLAADDDLVRKSGLPFTIEETFPLAGELATFQTRKFPFTLAAGVGILGVARNITARKRVEDSLRESEARFRAMFDAAQDGILIAEAGTRRFRYANPAICRMLGYSEAELLERGIADIHPAAELPRIIDIFTRQANGETTLAAGVPVQCRDGVVLWCDINAERLELHGVACLMGMFRDVTRQRQTEEKLRQAEKMQAVGQLAAGVAHDFNNMLACILGAAELAQPRLAADSPARRYLDIIAQSAGRAGELTGKLLAFSRSSAAEAGPVDLLRVLGDAIALLQTTTDRRIRIIQDVQATTGWITGDAAQLQNVLLNLGFNAVQAMPDGGTLTFVVRTVAAPAIEGLGPGTHLAIEVRDTGCGIPPEDIPRIFEPFFTTKALGAGTGLGLAVVFGTVQQHGGAIEVESTVGVGSCFRILLPLIAATPVGAPVTAPPASRNACILVVDDEITLRETISAALEAAGHRVLTAADGRQALEAFTARRDEIDLVILDMIMPVMNGLDCFAALRRIDPGVRVILASGYAPDADLTLMQSAGLRGHLRKPFRAEELARAIAQALAST